MREYGNRMRSMLIAICVALVALATTTAQEKTTLPQPTKEVKPGSTTAAMDAGIQGTVLVEVLVRADGTVGEARIGGP